MEDKEFITLEFDDENEVECEIIGIFDVDGKEYMALEPNDKSNDVYIYGYKEIPESDEFEIVEIEDEEEFNKAVAEFDSIMAGPAECEEE